MKPALLSLALLAALALAGCGKEALKGAAPNFQAGGKAVEELKIEDQKLGEGEEAKAGKRVKVHYTGWLASNNAKFDSSLDRGEPFEFGLGAGEVIAGWDQGVEGMKVGGKRRLTIPSHLGYGDRGAGGVIPPKATLLFDVELLEVR